MELMKKIPDNTIDLIYCDVLYGTGKDFEYYEDLKPIKRIIDAHYEPRLKEMHRTLSSTGSIYLHMDVRINHWIRCIMDDIFGCSNFKGEIIWHYDLGNGPKNGLKKKHDNILNYTKSKIFTYIPILIPSMNLKRYNLIDKDGRAFMLTNNGTRIVYADKGKKEDTVWSYLKTNKLRTLNPMSSERTGYPTQKPKELLKRIIESSSNKGDLVADFYMGSGTSMVVAKELNRNFIGCDITYKAFEITKQRLLV